MPHVETSAGELFYTVNQGPADGPELVLVHGAGGSRLHWPAELRSMAEATVRTVDLPGHGRSGGEGRMTVKGYAEALIAFLDATHVDRAIVAGHSMGGAIAQTLALRHPDRVSALMLIATGARLRVAPAILDGIQDDFEGTINSITQHAWSPDTDPSMKELGRAALRNTGPDVLLGDFQACHEFDVMDRLPRIEAPTLVINGTADVLTPLKYGRFLAEQLPRAQLVTVEGAGHMVMLERSEEVADAIKGFLSSHG